MKMNLSLLNSFSLSADPEALWVEDARDAFQEKKKNFASWLQDTHLAGSCCIFGFSSPGLLRCPALAVSSSQQHSEPSSFPQQISLPTQGFVAECLDSCSTCDISSVLLLQCMSVRGSFFPQGPPCSFVVEVSPVRQLLVNSFPLLTPWRMDCHHMLTWHHRDWFTFHEPSQQGLDLRQVFSLGTLSEPQGHWLILIMLFLYSSEFFPVLTTQIIYILILL